MGLAASMQPGRCQKNRNILILKTSLLSFNQALLIKVELFLTQMGKISHEILKHLLLKNILYSLQVIRFRGEIVHAA
jgi:hypothetical protein